MRRLLGPLLFLGILCTSAPALAAAPSNAGIQSLEVAVTYAHGGIDVFEIASGSKGRVIALPVLPNARNVTVSGGSYTMTKELATGRAALVRSQDGSARATFRVPFPASGDFLFVWRTPEPIRQLVVLAGPLVRPSGLGIAPFTLGGQVQVAGTTLTSFTAKDVPAGFTVRWPFEVGSPGRALGDLFLALAVAVPALALVLGLRAYVLPRREPQDTKD